MKYWQIAAKRKLVIIYTAVTLLLFSAGYAVYNAFPAVYKATCSIRFEKEANVGGLFSRILSTPEGDDLETQQVIITSYDLLTEVGKKLSLISGPGSVSNPEVYAVIDDLRSKVTFEKENNIIHISVIDEDPAFAQKMANILTETYSQQQSELQQKRLNEAVKYIEEELEKTRKNLEKSERQLNSYIQDNRLLSIEHQSGNLLLRKKELEDKAETENDSNKISKLKLDIQEVDRKINDLMDKKLKFDSLKKEIDSYRSLVSFLEEKKQEAMIRLAEKPNVIDIVSRAQLPSTSFNPPNILKTSLFGLAAGIILGLFLAILSEAFSSQARLISEIENSLGLNVLGIIPRTDRKKVLEGMDSDPRIKNDDLHIKIYMDLVSHFAPKTMISESFRALRTNILFAGGDEKARTIAVTSSYPREGKSMVAVNLAIGLAQAGLKTLLVGADFKNPAIGKIFSIDEEPGLTDALLGSCQWQETVKTVTDMILGKMNIEDLMMNPGLDHLNIITSGSTPSNSTELLNSQRFTEFIEAAEKEYDIIIFDSAPVLTSSDTAILGVKADALLVVNRPEFVSKERLKRAHSQLEQVNCNIMGVILNGVKHDLIPDALRNKYSRDYSVDATSEIQETTKTDKKKNHVFFKALILLLFIALLALGILWQMGILFPDKPSLTEREKMKPDTPVKVSPAEEKILPEKKVEQEERKKPDIVDSVKEEPPETIEVEPGPEKKEDESMPEEIKPEYQEGMYPYSIYLGSFKNIERAEKAIDHYSDREIDSFPVKVEFAEKGIWYRVYSGYYTDIEEAENFIKENNIKNPEIKKTAYACYIDSFTDNESLEKRINLLKEKLYFPYVITDHIDNVHFLFTGAFITRKAAEELSEELSANGIENRVVAR